MMKTIDFLEIFGGTLGKHIHTNVRKKHGFPDNTIQKVLLMLL